MAMGNGNGSGNGGVFRCPVGKVSTLFLSPWQDTDSVGVSVSVSVSQTQTISVSVAVAVAERADPDMSYGQWITRDA